MELHYVSFGDVHSLLVSSGIIRIRYFGVGSQFSLYHYVIEMNPEENESHWVQGTK